MRFQINEKLKKLAAFLVIQRRGRFVQNQQFDIL